ncbi:MAG: prepilin peptidase [Thermoanaerobaculia bacterium]
MLAAAAVYVDLRRRAIPNRLTLPALLVGLGVTFFADGWRGALIALAVVAAVFAAGFVLHAVGVVGGGDVKLFAAIAAAITPAAFVDVLIWTALFGGLVALVVLARASALMPFLRRLGRSGAQAAWGLTPEEPLVEGAGHQFPYAVVVLGGVVLSAATRYAGWRLASVIGA